MIGRCSNLAYLRCLLHMTALVELGLAWRSRTSCPIRLVKGSMNRCNGLRANESLGMTVKICPINVGAAASSAFLGVLRGKLSMISAVSGRETALLFVSEMLGGLWREGDAM